MKEQGIVIKIETNKTVIKIIPGKECERCGSCGVAHSRQVTVYGEDTRPLTVGEHVEVEIDSSVMLRMFCLLYGIPLTVFTGTVLMLYAFSKNPILSFLGAIGATAVSYVLVGMRIRRKREYSPKIIVDHSNKV